MGGCCGAVCCWRLLREPVSQTSFPMTIRMLTRVDTSSRSTRQRNRHSSLLNHHISRNDSTTTATTVALTIDSQFGLGCSFLFLFLLFGWFTPAHITQLFLVDLVRGQLRAGLVPCIYGCFTFNIKHSKSTARSTTKAKERNGSAVVLRFAVRSSQFAEAAEQLVRRAKMIVRSPLGMNSYAS